MTRIRQRGIYYWVNYEFQTMNGEARTGWTQMNRDIPTEGAQITVLYMQDRPQRSAPYPMTLVKVRDQY